VKKMLALFVVVAMVAVFTMGLTGCGKKDATPTAAGSAAGTSGK
jgi:uncharacterized lipoprotein YehR (DUF1307 family)